MTDQIIIAPFKYSNVFILTRIWEKAKRSLNPVLHYFTIDAQTTGSAQTDGVRNCRCSQRYCNPWRTATAHTVQNAPAGEAPLFGISRLTVNASTFLLYS
ncbi:hypothetical protein FKM82_002490 [Ascaphus truei]